MFCEALPCLCCFYECIFGSKYNIIAGMKDGFLKVAAASPELKVADPLFNVGRMMELFDLAKGYGVKVLVFPELSITGYTCQDLFFSDSLVEKAHQALSAYAGHSAGCDMLSFVGYPLVHNGKLYNTAVAVQNGRILSYTAKTFLPSYAEFQENRWFSPSLEKNIVLNDGAVFGNRIIHRAGRFSVAAEICEDLWVPVSPSVSHAAAGAQIIVNLSASDEVVGKDDYRRNLVVMHSAKTVSAYVYADASECESTSDMVFAGVNLIAENGTLLEEGSYALESLTVSEVDVGRIDAERKRLTTFAVRENPEYTYIDIAFDEVETVLTRRIAMLPFVPSSNEERHVRCEKILSLQAIGLKRRVLHTKARTLVVGLSGGLDSTLALLVCVRAMGMMGRSRKDILAITMPCFGTTKRTKGNAEKLASALGVSFRTIDIKRSVLSHFRDIGQDPEDLSVTYENAQARERTQVLMDVANSTGGLVVGTGDLSELALGWATYNGDHMSMYAVNASIPKTLVRHIVGHVASLGGPGAKVLHDILDTPVSPELLPAKDGVISQVTEDIVGPYELHDFFMYYLVRYGFGAGKIFRLSLRAFDGVYDRSTILKWLGTFLRRFFSQQFKRNCLPDGPKVGSVTFSPRSDWRMPSDASPQAWLDELEELR